MSHTKDTYEDVHITSMLRNATGMYRRGMTLVCTAVLLFVSSARGTALPRCPGLLDGVVRPVFCDALFPSP